MGTVVDTDAKFLLVQSGRGLHLDTYLSRRQLVEEQMRMLFLDLIWASGKTPAEDEQALRSLAAELVNRVNALPTETLNDWEAADAEDPEEDLSEG